MPNHSTSGTPGGTTSPNDSNQRGGVHQSWIPSKESFQFITNWPDAKRDQYITDEAYLLHDIRNLLVDVRNLLVHLAKR